MAISHAKHPPLTKRGRKTHFEVKTEAKENFSDRIRATMERLKLDETRIALYLGVRITTVRHWIAGDRHPSDSTLRLLEILEYLEQNYSVIHARFVPEQPMRGIGNRYLRPGNEEYLEPEYIPFALEKRK